MKFRNNKNDIEIMKRKKMYKNLTFHCSGNSNFVTLNFKQCQKCGQFNVGVGKKSTKVIKFNEREKKQQQ